MGGCQPFGLEIEPAEMKVDGVAEALPVAIATGASLDRLNARVEAFGAGIGRAGHDRVENASQVLADRWRYAEHRRQPPPRYRTSPAGLRSTSFPDDGSPISCLPDSIRSESRCLSDASRWRAGPAFASLSRRRRPAHCSAPTVAATHPIRRAYSLATFTTRGRRRCCGGRAR